MQASFLKKKKKKNEMKSETCYFESVFAPHQQPGVQLGRCAQATEAALLIVEDT
jgi:hypothetical protein